MMEDFGHFGDESLFDSYQPEWLERSDDYNVFEERQLDLDRDAGEYEMDDDSDEIVEPDDVQGFEDDGYEAALFGADC